MTPCLSVYCSMFYSDCVAKRMREREIPKFTECVVAVNQSMVEFKNQFPVRINVWCSIRTLEQINVLGGIANYLDSDC